MSAFEVTGSASILRDATHTPNSSVFDDTSSDVPEYVSRRTSVASSSSMRIADPDVEGQRRGSISARKASQPMTTATGNVLRLIRRANLTAPPPAARRMTAMPDAHRSTDAIGSAPHGAGAERTLQQAVAEEEEELHRVRYASIAPESSSPSRQASVLSRQTTVSPQPVEKVSTDTVQLVAESLAWGASDPAMGSSAASRRLSHVSFGGAAPKSGGSAGMKKVKTRREALDECLAALQRDRMERNFARQLHARTKLKKQGAEFTSVLQRAGARRESAAEDVPFGESLGSGSMVELHWAWDKAIRINTLFAARSFHRFLLTECEDANVDVPTPYLDMVDGSIMVDPVSVGSGSLVVDRETYRRCRTMTPVELLAWAGDGLDTQLIEDIKGDPDPVPNVTLARLISSWRRRVVRDIRVSKGTKAARSRDMLTVEGLDIGSSQNPSRRQSAFAESSVMAKSAGNESLITMQSPLLPVAGGAESSVANPDLGEDAGPSAAEQTAEAKAMKQFGLHSLITANMRRGVVNAGDLLKVTVERIDAVAERYAWLKDQIAVLETQQRHCVNARDRLARNPHRPDEDGQYLAGMIPIVQDELDRLGAQASANSDAITAMTAAVAKERKVIDAFNSEVRRMNRDVRGLLKAEYTRQAKDFVAAYALMKRMRNGEISLRDHEAVFETLIAWEPEVKSVVQLVQKTRHLSTKYHKKLQELAQIRIVGERHAVLPPTESEWMSLAPPAPPAKKPNSNSGQSLDESNAVTLSMSAEFFGNFMHPFDPLSLDSTRITALFSLGEVENTTVIEALEFYGIGAPMRQRQRSSTTSVPDGVKETRGSGFANTETAGPRKGSGPFGSTGDSLAAATSGTTRSIVRFDLSPEVVGGDNDQDAFEDSAFTGKAPRSRTAVEAIQSALGAPTAPDMEEDHEDYGGTWQPLQVKLSSALVSAVPKSLAGSMMLSQSGRRTSNSSALSMSQESSASAMNALDSSLLAHSFPREVVPTNNEKEEDAAPTDVGIPPPVSLPLALQGSEEPARQSSGEDTPGSGSASLLSPLSPIQREPTSATAIVPLSPEKVVAEVLRPRPPPAVVLRRGDNLTAEYMMCRYGPAGMPTNTQRRYRGGTVGGGQGGTQGWRGWGKGGKWRPFWHHPPHEEAASKKKDDADPHPGGANEDMGTKTEKAEDDGPQPVALLPDSVQVEELARAATLRRFGFGARGASAGAHRQLSASRAPRRPATAATTMPTRNRLRVL